MMRMVLLLGLLILANGVEAGDLFNTEGYRIDNYRRSTPDEAPAGKLLDTAGLQRLMHNDSPVLIDVQAITLRPESAEFGEAWLPSSTRLHIPGSTWLPNVGYGYLPPRMLDYFFSNLERLTNGERYRPVVIYCVLDCWMSWNAVRRAADFEFTNLHWYPQGTDGWADAGLELVEATPEPLPPATFFTTYDHLDLRRMLARANASGRDLLLFFETGHCPFCARMHRSVLIDPTVIEHLQRDFIALAIDMDSAAVMFDPSGGELTHREFAVSGQRVVRTPTLLFYDAGFNLLHRHSGLIATAVEMIRLFDYVAERAYESVSWRDFNRPR